MTRETLLEILAELGEKSGDAIQIRKGQDLAIHIGPVREGVEVLAVERVELRPGHVRISSARGQMFSSRYEDVSLIVTSTTGSRAGFNG